MSEHEHEYVDTYSGSGVSRKSDNIMVVVVFCKKCLDVKTIEYSLSLFKDPEEYQYD